jgi:uncharacterized membrane protein YgdD (TMEM256/DUF423 family)
MERFCIGIGALFGGIAVAMAALAAHGAATRMDASMLQVLRSGVEMQGWHALALLFTGLWLARGGLPAVLAAIAFIVGMVLFCGSLYALAFTGVQASLAPAGGTVLMLGWLLLAVSALRRWQ